MSTSLSQPISVSLGMCKKLVSFSVSQYVMIDYRLRGEMYTCASCCKETNRHERTQLSVSSLALFSQRRAVPGVGKNRVRRRDGGGP